MVLTSSFHVYSSSLADLSSNFGGKEVALVPGIVSNSKTIQSFFFPGLRSYLQSHLKSKMQLTC